MGVVVSVIAIMTMVVIVSVIAVMRMVVLVIMQAVSLRMVMAVSIRRHPQADRPHRHQGKEGDATPEYEDVKLGRQDDVQNLRLPGIECNAHPGDGPA
jgi:hypothetical protein